MSDVAIQPDTPQPTHTKRAWLLVLIVIAAAVSIWFVYFTETGRRTFTRENAMQFAEEHWLIVPVVVVLAFTAMSLMTLPTWWLQVMCGVCFGLWYGTFLAVVASTIAAGVTAWFARWSAGEWFTSRIENKLVRLRKLEAAVNRNALAAVVIMRITPFVPFGLGNYMLGLFHVPMSTILIGTFVGAIPRIAFWAQWGIADPSSDPVVFWTIIGVYAAALSTIPLRYLKPEWFRKMGIE